MKLLVVHNVCLSVKKHKRNTSHTDRDTNHNSLVSVTQRTGRQHSYPASCVITQPAWLSVLWPPTIQLQQHRGPVWFMAFTPPSSHGTQISFVVTSQPGPWLVTRWLPWLDSGPNCANWITGSLLLWMLIQPTCPAQQTHTPHRSTELAVMDAGRHIGKDTCTDVSVTYD